MAEPSSPFSRSVPLRLALSALLIAAASLPAALASSARLPTWEDVASSSGLAFDHDNGARGDYFLPEIMGSGVALLDYDDDGDLDVFVVQGSELQSGSKEEGGKRKEGGNRAGGTSRLFRNDVTITDGRPVLRFTDVTESAEIRVGGMGMGVASGDYDGDGDVDLYVTRFGSNVLLRNDGDGTFTDATAAAGVDDPRWSTSAAFVDGDRDGDLDLFVANYVDFTVAGNKICRDPVGARDYCAPSSYRPVPGRYFRNEGQGRFADATETAGFSRAYGAGLGVAVGDYNGDGWLDLYVANDATPNQLWINRQDGTFADEGWLSGTAVNAAGRPEGSMGIASGDVDEDGDEDLVVTNLTRETFVGYVNDGAGNFEDRRAEMGIAAATADHTGFGADWLDADNDGHLDLLVANGAVNIIPAQRGSPAPFRQRLQLFHNEGRGRLRDVSDAAGPLFARLDVGRGLAVGDLDNDGDLDAIVTNNCGPARLLLNGGSKAAWLIVRLAQPGANRAAFGARVGVVRSGRPTLWRRVGTDGSYLSAGDPRIHVGLGDLPAVDAVVVEWPDGMREQFAGVQANRIVTLERGRGRP